MEQIVSQFVYVQAPPTRKQVIEVLIRAAQIRMIQVSRELVQLQEEYGKLP